MRQFAYTKYRGCRDLIEISYKAYYKPMTSGFFSFYQIQFPATGAFSIEISEHMHNLNSEKRDEVDIQLSCFSR